MAQAMDYYDTRNTTPVIQGSKQGRPADIFESSKVASVNWLRYVDSLIE
jgi:hypothetical protein